MDKKEPLKIIIEIVILVLIIIILGIGFSFWKIGRHQKSVSVATNQKEYVIGDTLKIKIKNNLEKNICFSSCYPYYFEKKNTETEWMGYNYPNCPNDNLNETCIGSKQIKAFEFILPALEKGVHRIAIPICVGCKMQEAFRDDQWFYSNEFITK